MFDRTRLSAARDVATRAAVDAGRFIRSQVGMLDRNSIRDKGLHELVTHVDEGAQDLILGHIRTGFPDDAILAEEDLSEVIASKGNGYRWIIDPLDGTTNFAHAVPPYAVSIGLEHHGSMVVGVVYEVSRDELFCAVRGEGATLNGSPIRVSPTSTLSDSLLTTGFPYRTFEHVDAYFDVLRVFFRATRGVRRPGAASVDLAWVACGRFEGFFETGLSPWDTAAGVLLVEEAGGRVTDYGEGRDPVHGRQILASNGLIHEAMQTVLVPMRTARS